MTPILYVKTGCPYCKAAIDYLDGNNIRYEKIDVRADKTQMKALEEISGQTMTPTMKWGDGAVLSDFGVEELEEFLKTHPVA
jgi:glutaredoxin